jgi:hypothetical protein
MAIFACCKCGHSYEQMVSNNYARKILRRLEQCVRCNRPTYHNFVSHSGRVAGTMEREGTLATQFWRKTRNGAAASAPLDRVCKDSEW